MNELRALLPTTEEYWLHHDTRSPRTWCTCADPFATVCATDVVPWLGADQEGRLQVLRLFDEFCVHHPGQFLPGQFRTLRRCMYDWRALDGPAQEVFFEREAVPGREDALVFTDPSDLGVTMQRHPFDHL